MRVAAVACLSIACAQPPDHPPIARISLAPPAVLAHDEFQTEVTLDGRTSAASEDPAATLRFAWQLLDDEARTTDRLDAPMLVARFRGVHPPRIVLVVTDPDGHTGEDVRSVELTLP